MNSNLAEVLKTLQRSDFRRSQRLGRKDSEYLQNKGLQTVVEHARDFVAKRLAPAEPTNDGKQTPWRGHPVFVAQHATATCCRGCIEKWHRIERGLELTEVERDYIVRLIEAWLKYQTDPIVPHRTSRP
jgi:hypothetical protein